MTYKCVFFLSLIQLLIQGNVGQDPYKSQQFKSQNMSPVNMTEYSLMTETDYPTFVELTAKSFRKVVMPSYDCWIVVVYDKTLQLKWSEHSKQVQGSLFYGVVDINEEQELVRQWDEELSVDDIRGGVAFVFPFGNKQKKVTRTQFWPQKTRKVVKAEEIARGSYADFFVKLDFLPENMEIFNEWMITSFYKSTPPKFPVVCLYDGEKDSIPLSFLAMAHYFTSHFAFSLVHKDNFPLLKQQIHQIPTPKTYPFLFIMLGKEPSQEEMATGEFSMSFNILPYLEDKYGMAEKFIPLVKYLFTTNDDYRQLLPGRHLHESEDTAQMRDVAKTLNKRITKIKRNTKVIRHEEL